MSDNPMKNYPWAEALDASILVCDLTGKILEMNEQAARNFALQGGKDLLGKNLLDCHPEPAKGKLLALIQQQKSNVYTIEKKGVKKLIYQTPWYREGTYAGLVEITFIIPAEMPHFIRG